MNLLRFDSQNSWVDGIASLWRDRLHLNPSLKLCLPSGHTPNPVYAAMARAVAARQVTFRQAEIFALDEFGGLAPADPGRCANMLKHHLLDHIDLPFERFHPIDPDAADLARACGEYESLIGEGFDLAVLGLGLNGHLGLNEPGSPIDSGVRKVTLHPSTISGSARYLAHENLPTWGVTVGMKQLLASREVWLLANDPSKSGIVERLVKEPITVDVPASLIRHHPNACLIVDAPAGARV